STTPGRTGRGVSRRPANSVRPPGAAARGPWPPSDDADMTISDVPTQTLPAEGEIGFGDIGSLPPGGGGGTFVRRSTPGGGVARPRQRCGGAACAHRRLAHHRAGRARASDTRLVG